MGNAFSAFSFNPYKQRTRTDAKGSCFYSSLIQCTDPNNHNNANIMKLRLSLCGHVEKNWKYFVHFILPCDQEAVTKYVKKQKLNNTWGGEIELVAFVQKSRKRLEVYNVFGEKIWEHEPIKWFGSLKTVKIVYHQKHYEPFLNYSFRKKHSNSSQKKSCSQSSNPPSSSPPASPSHSPSPPTASPSHSPSPPPASPSHSPSPPKNTSGAKKRKRNKSDGNSRNQKTRKCEYSELFNKMIKIFETANATATSQKYSFPSANNEGPQLILKEMSNIGNTMIEIEKAHSKNMFQLYQAIHAYINSIIIPFLPLWKRNYVQYGLPPPGRQVSLRSFCYKCLSAHTDKYSSIYQRFNKINRLFSLIPALESKEKDICEGLMKKYKCSFENEKYYKFVSVWTACNWNTNPMAMEEFIISFEGLQALEQPVFTGTIFDEEEYLDFESNNFNFLQEQIKLVPEEVRLRYLKKYIRHLQMNFDLLKDLK